MREGPDIARIASLVGDPARANMLTALMDGGALTASELAVEAGVTLPTASSHLAKLMDGYAGFSDIFSIAFGVVAILAPAAILTVKILRKRSAMAREEFAVPE